MEVRSSIASLFLAIAVACAPAAYASPESARAAVDRVVADYIGL